MKVGYFEAQHDFYAILGVPASATADEIRRAHRRLVWELHPDRPRGRQGAERRISLVNLASTVLLNPASRARYDELRQQAKSGRLPYPSSTPEPRARPRGASTAHRVRRSRAVDPRPGPLVADDFLRRLFGVALTATLLIACISERTKPTEAEKRRFDQRPPDPILYAPDYPPIPVRYATVDPE